MPTIGQTLTEDIGPLPTWAWAGGGTLLLAGYLIYRKKQSVTAAASQQATSTSSNLGTVPISNLTTAAFPMPIQMGDTFVQTAPSSQTVTSDSTTGATTGNAVTVNTPPPPSQPSQPGYGIVNTVKGPMILLGQIGGGSGYEVAGGAPVYFGNTQTLATGAAAEKQGASVYTPVSYAGQVAQSVSAAAPFK